MSPCAPEGVVHVQQRSGRGGCFCRRTDNLERQTVCRRLAVCRDQKKTRAPIREQNLGLVEPIRPPARGSGLMGELSRWRTDRCSRRVPFGCACVGCACVGCACVGCACAEARDQGSAAARLPERRIRPPAARQRCGSSADRHLRALLRPSVQPDPIGHRDRTAALGLGELQRVEALGDAIHRIQVR